MEKTWEIAVSLSAWDETRDEMFQVMKSFGISSSEANSYLVGVEEAAVNIIQYAYPSSESSFVFWVKLETIACEAGKIKVECTLTDCGIPFDPTNREGKTPGSPGAYKEAGGWGIQMIKSKVDTMVYKRIDEKNVLILNKTMEAK